MDADLFERWFVIADQDHDGMVSGSEAVEFFGRSNLGQETLFQVLVFSPPMTVPKQWSIQMARRTPALLLGQTRYHEVSCSSRGY